MTAENVLKAFMVICGSLEIMLFGGIIFGWASLVYIYKDEGYFSHLCPLNQSSLSNASDSSVQTAPSGLFGLNTSQTFGGISSAYDFNSTSGDVRLIVPKVTCKEQDNQFNLIFTISTVFTGIMCFVNGLLYDKFGTRFCRVIAIVCFIGAMLCLIFASPERPLLLYPGATLLVYGGYLLLVTNLQLANLTPCFRSTIMSLYAGSYDCSAVIFLAFKYFTRLPVAFAFFMTCVLTAVYLYDSTEPRFFWFLPKAAHEAGIKVNTCFLIQACAFSLIVGVSTFFTLPKRHLPWPLPEGFRVNPPIQQLCQTAEVDKADTKGDLADTEPGNKTFEQPEIDKNTNRSSPNLDGSQKVNRGQPVVKTLGGSQAGEFDMSSQNCLLAINHVPRLSTSMLYHSNLSVNTRSRLGTRTSVPRQTQSVRSPPHHLSLLNIPQIRRTISHDQRPSVSLENMNSGKNLDIPSHGTLMPSGHASAPHSSPANSPFLSLHSVAGISSIGDVEGDNPDLIYEGESVYGVKQSSLRKELCSPLFVMEVMWMSFQRLRSWFFVGVFNPWITTMAAGDRGKISYYTSVFSAMQFFGIFTAPMSGRLMDRKPGKKYQYNSPKFERLHAAIASFVLNCTVVLMLSICAAIPVLEVQYLTFALHVINRSFIYGPNSAFVANAFPFEYFGILLGTTLTLSAIFGMIQYPLFLIIQGPLHDDPMIINIVLIVLMLLTYAHPAYIWVYLTRKLKKKKLAESGESSEPLRKKETDEADLSGLQGKEPTPKLETEREEQLPRERTSEYEEELYADENKCTHL